jgi:hypothetical protein
MPAAGLAAPLPIASPGPDLSCTDDPELFFAESPDDVELAKALCRECPARAACLAGALKRREPWGVWGANCSCAARSCRANDRGDARAGRSTLKWIWI